jgi:hypothetical protein
MNTYHPTQRKEVTTLDDVPLVRPSLIRFNVSELRISQGCSSRFKVRRLLLRTL